MTYDTNSLKISVFGEIIRGLDKRIAAMEGKTFWLESFVHALQQRITELERKVAPIINGKQWNGEDWVELNEED